MGGPRIADLVDLASLEVANVERIGRFGMFRLSEFRTGLRYRRESAGGEPLIESVSTRVRGRALVVKSLDKDSETTHHDDRRVEEKAP